MIRRHVFPMNVSLAGGAKSDTGILAGNIDHFEWAPDVGDTGQPATITLAKFPKQADTGHGYVFYSAAGINLGAPLRALNPPSGTDTGSTFVQAVGGANERLQVKITPADTGVNRTGNFYVYSRED